MVSNFFFPTRYRSYAEREKMTAIKNKTAKTPVVMFDLKIFMACTPVYIVEFEKSRFFNTEFTKKTKNIIFY